MLAHGIINMDIFFYRIMNDAKHTNIKFYVNIAIKKKEKVGFFS